jgi:hypothetical protein
MSGPQAPELETELETHIIMEYCPQGSLRAALDSGKWAPTTTAEVRPPLCPAGRDTFLKSRQPPPATF